MPEKVGYPLSVLDVGLATRHRPDMTGVDHPDAELVLHQVDDRLPVDPCALHGDVGDSALPKPVRQLQKLSGGCAKRPRILGLRSHHTSDHRLLMYIQSTASIIYDSHRPPQACRPVGSSIHLNTLLCVLTAGAGQHSYMPVSHPGRFRHGLAAPMTTALVVPTGANPISSCLCGLRKAMVIPAQAGIQRGGAVAPLAPLVPFVDTHQKLKTRNPPP